MSFRNSIKTTIQSLREFEPGEEIIGILEDFGNENELRDAADVEDKLIELRDRYESDQGKTSMNLYPSDNPGGCHSFCLAIAAKPFNKPRAGLNSGFNGIMLEMAAYWFGCLHANRETLILTRDWDSDQFQNLYKKIIDNYTREHKKRVFIIEVGPSGLFRRYPF